MSRNVSGVGERRSDLLDGKLILIYHGLDRLTRRDQPDDRGDIHSSGYPGNGSLSDGASVPGGRCAPSLGANLARPVPVDRPCQASGGPPAVR